MSPEMFLELWELSCNYIQKKDRLDAAESFVRIYDDYGKLEDLKEILGSDTYLDTCIAEQFEDDEELIEEYNEDFYDE